MKYVETNLTAGEGIMYTARLHWIVLAGPAVIAAFFAIPGLLLLFAPDTRLGSVVMLLIGASFFLFGWLRRNAFECAVTNRRVVYRKGLLSIATDEIFLDKVESVLVNQSLVGRWLDYGNVTVRGTGGSWEPFKEIENPLLLRRHVQEQLEKRNSELRTAPVPVLSR